MRIILGIIFALIASPVNAIVVIGEAKSYELAKQQAFKQAIDYEVGVIVDTERFAVDSELVHNQILTYSAGYILDYKVISHSESNNTHTVKMDVTVASSKLKDYLLSRNEYRGEFSGDILKTQIEFYKNGLIDKDRLLNNTLKYFPTEAFNIEIEGYSVSVDPNRKFYLEVQYVISWDQKFLMAFKELLSLFDVEDKSYGFVEFGRKDILYFHDQVFMKHIANRMTRTDFVEINMNNLRGHSILNTCVQNILYDPQIGWNSRLAMYSKRGTGFSIFADKVIHSFVVVPITSTIYDSLQDVTQMSLRVTTNNDCPQLQHR